MNPGFFERIVTRIENFFDVAEEELRKMASLPQRMERNLKALIVTIIGAFIIIAILNRQKGK